VIFSLTAFVERKTKVVRSEIFVSKRYELTDEQWALIEPILPKRMATTGRKPKDPRQMLNGIVWILRSGAPWRDLPERYGPWQTVYDSYGHWRDDGTFDRILSALQIRLDRQGRIDWDLWCIDGSSVRAARAAAGATRKAFASTRTSPPTTLWAARVADGAANSIWLLTAEACPWRWRSRPGNGRNRRKSKR
jgi:transposase